MNDQNKYNSTSAFRPRAQGREAVYGLRSTDYERGVTLVIAIVMLAGVTFLSFALSTIILREIRSAQTILRTEPAISGAYAGGEVGLFQFVRELGGTSTSGSTPQSGASFTVESDLYDDPFIFSTSDGEMLSIGLYDAEQPNNVNADYGSVTVRSDAGSDVVSIAVYSWSDPDNRFCQTNLSGGSSFTCSALNQPDDRYIVEIDPVPASGSASGELTATDNAGNPRGIPSETPGIDSTGEKDDVQRRIEIRF